MTTIRKNLSMSALLSTVRQSFEKIEVTRGRKKPTIPLVDCLMSGLAIYGLKFPSLLQYDKHKVDPIIQANLQSIYHVNVAPSDTTMRERLDVVEPKELRK